MLCEVDTGGISIFKIDEKEEHPYLTLSSVAGDSVESRTNAVAQVTEKLRHNGIVTGWRDETYPISDSFYSPPLFHMERAAVSLLGVLEYGVHINGLVREKPGEPPKMWIARRSKTKSKFPGMLDHVVAGGQPSDLSLMDNVIKECKEEAGIPETTTRAGIQPAGAISYEHFDPHKERVTRCVLFNYDLYLPKEFSPTPVDGEAEEFFLFTMEQIKESMAPDFPDPIKPNCYVVIIDFMLRMGHVSPEAPGYLDVLRELRSGDCR
jgi:8-oxo-dGTP pyrophosphatase MutT (NUDIX family)